MAVIIFEVFPSNVSVLSSESSILPRLFAMVPSLSKSKFSVSANAFLTLIAAVKMLLIFSASCSTASPVSASLTRLVSIRNSSMVMRTVGKVPSLMVETVFKLSCVKESFVKPESVTVTP